MRIYLNKKFDRIPSKPIPITPLSSVNYDSPKTTRRLKQPFVHLHRFAMAVQFITDLGTISFLMTTNWFEWSNYSEKMMNIFILKLRFTA
ncbi:hypothetical protein Golob_012370 [Gossypium lobatum]|uniref:Uncharacterized protein n=1 Tax=Gossypium lobatum TaxID=34289 RepID=A0A7J8LL72_9ROSI|nr:hypothetical protein [Gossypium lobatum]